MTNSHEKEKNSVVNEESFLSKDLEFKLKVTEEALKKSEARFTAILDAFPGMLNVVDSNYNIISASKNLVERTEHRSLKDVIGGKCYRFWKQRDTICPECEVTTVLDTGKPYTRHCTLEEAKLTGMYSDAYIAPIRDSNGKIIGAVKIMLDVSGRLKTEEKLKTSEKKFRQISENTPASVYQFKMSHDKSFSFPYVSKRILGIMGVSAQEVMRDASNLINLVHPEDLEMFVEKVMISAKNLTPYHEIFRCVKGETTVWVECRTTPTPMSDGSILWDGFFLDITERKQAEEERERLISELKDALSEVKTLKGFIPICASCKKIRDDEGYWQQIERYIQSNSEAEFSHSICPDCAKTLYPELYEKNKDK